MEASRKHLVSKGVSSPFERVSSREGFVARRSRLKRITSRGFPRAEDGAAHPQADIVNGLPIERPRALVKGRVGEVEGDEEAWRSKLRSEQLFQRTYFIR
eukprot:3671454-Pleurochrysis_carterae.AAC.4